MSNESILHAVLAKLQQTQRLLQSPAPPPDMPIQVEVLIAEAIQQIQTTLGIPQWPEPTVDEPDLETLEEWLWEEAGCEATDGCWTDSDGTCPHGHPAWLLKLGLI